jgi:hypothetical protein
MNAATQFRVGETWGLPIMKFTLTYDGPLPPSANKGKNKEKWVIRKKIHVQLADLWATHPALREVEANRYFPKFGGAALTQVHHQHPGPVIPIRGFQQPAGEILDLCEPITKHGALFLPLVRESYALHCGLKILFLRKEQSGKVYQAATLTVGLKR